MMSTQYWIIGPQLIGLIFLIVGLVQKRYPPKHINSLYGYRTPSSIKNQQTWDEANGYSATLLIKLGVWLMAGGFALTIILTQTTMADKLRAAMSAVLLIIGAIGSAILLIVLTEKHLRKVFDNKPQ